jgi:hypothetical protein
VESPQVLRGLLEHTGCQLTLGRLFQRVDLQLTFDFL